jgi:polysaccharide pyruvyl transferase WcaK-like protein
MEMCDLVIASRFHAVVLPFALQKPVLAISYQRKLRDLMADCGQASYHRELDKTDLTGLIELFRALEQRRESIAQHLGVVVSKYRSRLDEQYEAVFCGGNKGRGLGIAPLLTVHRVRADHSRAGDC